MKVAVIANCQGESLVQCIRAMNPGFHAVDLYPSTTLQNGQVQLEALQEGYDHVFAQRFVREMVKPRFAGKMVYFPSIAFSAYQPDMTFLVGRRKGSATQEVVPSPLSTYHSSIAVFGHAMGIPLEQILTFYNSFVYARLGFLDRWDSSRDALLEEGRETGMPMEGLLAKWSRGRCFMYSFNHPELTVLADIAARLLERIGVPVVNHDLERYVRDPLRDMPIWPVYPEIAARYGLVGDHAFKPQEPHGIMTLNQFVTDCYAIYRDFEASSLQPLNFRVDEYAQRLGFTGASAAAAADRVQANPYQGLPDRNFWKRSVADLPPGEVDPVAGARFLLDRETRVATAGSCFAQHIAKTLTRNGFHYYVTETRPAGMDDTEAASRNYGVFSARYGNIYTVRQMHQLIQRVQGRFVPHDQVWRRRDGRLVDPFRPQVEPEGFETEGALYTARAEHFAAVQTMLETMDVLVFTLGLTEGWRSRRDGAVFPLAPGVAGGEMDPDEYEFVNFTVDEVLADLRACIEAVATINPACKVILTVSPVPLIATYEPRHVLASTTYSKSVLRVAAETASREYGHVAYFPSYEVITGPHARGAYFDEDLRTVKPEGVAHVMRLFMKHYLAEGSAAEAASAADAALAPTPAPQTTSTIQERRLFDIVCDEEAIVNFQP